MSPGDAEQGAAAAARTAWPGSVISVVGIGADGWPGLSGAARAAVEDAEVVFGSGRQLELLPASVAGERIAWPSPLLPALRELLLAQAYRRVCVLASGDPMFYGIGVTLARLFGPGALRVLPQPSSASLACARLGWALADIPVVSAVGRPLAGVLPELTDGRRLLVLSADERTPVALAELLCANGFGASGLTVLEQLGGPAERIGATTAAGLWTAACSSMPPRAHPASPEAAADGPPGADGVDPHTVDPHTIDSLNIDPLNIVAVQVVRSPDAARLTRMPGLPDESFGGDGQLTKAEVRALTLSALAPAPGELLWDVGGGSGSIAIEWCRTHPSCRAVTFERLERRRAGIAENARALGVPQVAVRGEALAALAAESGMPDAIFVGGGLTQDGLLEVCRRRLRPGGRLVANAVTAETEALVVRSAAEHGGQLRKFQIYRAEPLGGFTAWRPHLPVAQWIWVKPAHGTR
ncbi:MAG TPA: precorrin-6y C5,15-methyltransferase (decarboxylating) subunit CbiE [Nocardia sp.]|uniref:precorrin-6y C5,15-methyltransferase (decarboxylating) subunit CbiE n=1 Tax=Nocardia sp. TaxID=1821 RepID=UPI002B4B24AB|nr:precorrin-6y C5,15-methyltransferase (decarboxylating) subunit CbiE [Nocardia sp.]HLS78478.1 precorrin-6y C5,15-methyltransferase (decarboxylating) subunit CbiE [Nocardia sp.]